MAALCQGPRDRCRRPEIRGSSFRKCLDFEPKAHRENNAYVHDVSRFRLLPLAVLAAVALSGCQASGTAVAVDTTLTASPVLSGRQTVGQTVERATEKAIRTLDNAILPLNVFAPTPEQQARLVNAVRHSVALCTNRFEMKGYDDTLLPPQRDMTPRARRYLFVDPGLAARYGYAVPLPSPSQQQKPPRSARTDTGLTPIEEQAVLNGQGPKTVRGIRVPEDGCIGAANRRVMEGVPPDVEFLVVRLGMQAYDKALGDPRVKAVNAAWSACMRRAGYTYPTPVKAWEDPRWRKQGDTREEATAVADMRCKLQVNYLTVRLTTEIEAQQTMIKAHGPELRAFRRHLRTRLANAAAMLGERP
ncbi:hypothetical protein [Microbispora rosea]|uniref:hypothetical protein n=1 Tax=Microbispora rosea TaxID=58117 RepID=UPI003448BE7F